MLHVETIPVGPMQANAHIAWVDDVKDAVVVDPGDDAETILAAVEKHGLKVAAIWNTHAHVDHIRANAAVHAATGAPIHIHPLEESWLRDPMKNLGAWIGLPVEPSSADVLWNDGDEIEALGLRWRIAHTPGHSPGSVCIVCDDEHTGFGGDLLMEGSMGRVDFPGCDPAAMAASLRKALAWDGRLVLHTGHGGAVTIADELAHNATVRDFLSQFPQD